MCRVRIGGWLRRFGGQTERGQRAEDGISLLVDGDGWSRAVEDRLLALDAKQVRALSDVLAEDYGARPHESWYWHTKVRVLLQEQNHHVLEVLNAMLEALADADPYAAPGGLADARPILVSKENTACAVNTIWASVEANDARAADRIGRILDRALTEPWTVDSVRIRNACGKALAEIGTHEAADLLASASRLASTRAQREQLLRCLERAGQAGDQPPSLLAELHVPHHGLDESGRRTLTVRRHRFELRLRADGRVTVTDENPAATPDTAAKRVAATEAGAIRTAYRRELTRVEELLATDRRWSYEDWHTTYLGNPITRAVASRLVWRFELEDGQTIEVMPAFDGGFSAVDGQVADAPPILGPATTSSVHLWHPRDAEPEALAAWRAVLASMNPTQPFEQIARDFTRVEPEPEALEITQFDGVTADAAQFASAYRRLRWKKGSKSKSGSSRDQVTFIEREFADESISILTMYSTGESVRLGTAWFHRTEGGGRAPLPMADVPVRVYSEAVRDISLLSSGTRLPDDDVSDSLDWFC